MNHTPTRSRTAVAANQVLDTPLGAGEQAAMIEAAAVKFAELFDILHIAHRDDHNTRDTPQRVPQRSSVEFARRSIEPGIRASFSELEAMLKDQKEK